MPINLKAPDVTELKPRITVIGVGGAGCNAVNNMIASGLEGVEFIAANTDAQALAMSSAERRIQMGVGVTEGLGAGAQPEVGVKAAEEALPEIEAHLEGVHMAFVTAGMGGGTGTGAAPVIARVARSKDVLTVGVVTKPFQFEGRRRMMIAEAGIAELAQNVDTLIIIPNQNLFRIANEKTTFADAFTLADRVLHAGIACITDLMVKEGLINLDFADVRMIMKEGGRAMMGTGEASGEGRGLEAAEAAISNPLLDDVSLKGAKGLLISITGGSDLTLFEVDEAANRVRKEVDPDADIIIGATFDESLDGKIRVSVVATGLQAQRENAKPSGVASDEGRLTQRLQGIASNGVGAVSPTAQRENPASQSATRPISAPLTPRPGEPMSSRGQQSEHYPGTSEPTSPLRSASHQPPSDNKSGGGTQNENNLRIDPALPRFPSHLSGDRGGHGTQMKAGVAKDKAFTPQPLRMPTKEDFPPNVQDLLSENEREARPKGLEEYKRRAGFFDKFSMFGRHKKQGDSKPMTAKGGGQDNSALPHPPLSAATESKNVTPNTSAPLTNGQRGQTDRPTGQPHPPTSSHAEEDAEIPEFFRSRGR